MRTATAPLLLTLMLSPGAAAAPGEVLSVGGPARMFSLPSLNEDVSMEILGRSRVALSDFAGVSPQASRDAVVLYFFDREHGGAGLATLHRVQRQLGSKGVQVLAISTDRGDLGAMSTWVEGQKLSFPVLRDNHHVVLDRYGFRVDQLPLLYVLESDGDIVAVGQPDGASLAAELDAELQPLLVER